MGPKPDPQVLPEELENVARRAMEMVLERDPTRDINPRDMVDAVVGANAVVTAAAIKTTTFWTSNPEQWYLNLEGQFALNGITADTTRYYYVLNALPESISHQVMAVSAAPPAVDKYGALKRLLMKLLGRRRLDKSRELCRVHSLDGRSAVGHLAYMRALASATDVVSDMFRSAFIFSLPPNVREHYLHEDGQSLDDIAESADSRLFAAQSGDADAVALRHIHAVELQEEEDPGTALVPASASVDRISGYRGQRQSSRQPGRQHQQPLRQPQPPRSGQSSAAATSFVCRNHQKFGPDTFTCQSPNRCLWARHVVPAPLNAGASRR